MNLNETIIKEINDHENELKEFVRNIIQKEIALNNYSIKLEKANIIIERLNIGFLVLELLLPNKNLFIILYFIAIIIINKLLHTARVARNDAYYNLLKMRKNDINDKIDSIETFKSYLRNRPVTIEEKMNIIENLYLTYPNYIEPMINELEEDNVKLELVYPSN